MPIQISSKTEHWKLSNKITMKFTIFLVATSQSRHLSESGIHRLVKKQNLVLRLCSGANIGLRYCWIELQFLWKLEFSQLYNTVIYSKDVNKHFPVKSPTRVAVKTHVGHSKHSTVTEFCLVVYHSRTAMLWRCRRLLWLSKNKK